jgi:hypothetical protein
VDEVQFTLNGRVYRLTRNQVIRAMRNQTPGRIQTYSVDVEGTDFPVKQALAQALQIKNTEFVSTRAQDILRKLGFHVVNVDDASRDDVEEAALGRRGYALVLAVTLHAGQSDDVERVIATASRLDTWLGR